MFEPKFFVSFIMYIIIEYLLIFICFLIYIIEFWTLFFLITSYVFLTTMIISCPLCSPQKIRLAFFYFTIQICQLLVFLLEIEHCWYELLFVAHFLPNRWEQFHMFLWDQIHINRVGPGTFLRIRPLKFAVKNVLYFSFT